MKIENRLREMGFELPEVAKPVAAYVPAINVNGWIYTSGQLPMVDGEVKFSGKISGDVSVEDGKKAAAICALNALAALKSVAGSLDNVEQIIKLVGYVNSNHGFSAQPTIINGASELLKAIFAEKGAHARSAIGVSELPLNACVEIELIAKVNEN